MARFATIDAGRVTNIIEADAEFAASIGAISAAGAAIGWLWDGQQFIAPPAPAFDLALAIKSAVLKIDADADKIYGDVVGNKGEEYRSAEADAKAFVAAGYIGVAGSGVTSWATAKGWTVTQAANDIIAQATAWRGAQAAIRAQRLGKKEAVRAATDSAAIDALMGQWAAFVTSIRTQLGV